MLARGAFELDSPSAVTVSSFSVRPAGVARGVAAPELSGEDAPESKKGEETGEAEA